MSAAADFGVAPVVVLRQSDGVYDPTTGQTGAPLANNIQILQQDEKETVSDGGTAREFSFLILRDDMPVALSAGDQIERNGGERWNVTEHTLDPTGTFYEAKAAR
jgi:hypothetical protein